jgi:hypothetical protein
MSKSPSNEEPPRRYLVRHPVSEWTYQEAPKAALREAGKSIYVGDTRRSQHLSELHEHGETTITYGFATLVITSEGIR